MFTISQIEDAHARVQSGADFPAYIQDLKELGIVQFTTWTLDSHTEYEGNHGFRIESKPKYDALVISNEVLKDEFLDRLSIHQKGETDYYTFCVHCAECGISRWIMDLNEMTCTYYDSQGQEVIEEKIIKKFGC